MMSASVLWVSVKWSDFAQLMRLLRHILWPFEQFENHLTPSYVVINIGDYKRAGFLTFWEMHFCFQDWEEKIDTTLMCLVPWAQQESPQELKVFYRTVQSITI